MTVPYSSARIPSLGQLNDVQINTGTLANDDIIKYSTASNTWVNAVLNAEVPLTFSTGLTRTVNTITNNLSTGVAGGQTAIGGTGVTDKLLLKGTTGNGTSASPAVEIITGNNGATTALTVLNNGNVGIGTSSPASKLTVRDTTTTGGTAGINVQKTGTTSGNSYGILAQTTGGSTTNYGGFFTATGATNNYGLVVSSGAVGIGTTAPAYDLQVGTSNGTITIGGAPTFNGSGYLNFVNSNSVTNWRIASNGVYSGAFEITPSTTVGGSTFTTPAMLISSVGAVTIANLGTGSVHATSGVLSTTSDARLKDEDGGITDALTKVLKLKPRYFKWKKDNLSGLPSSIRQLGFFAQEVQSVLGEEVVNTPPEGGNYGIHDRGIIAMLVKALQEQQVIIDLLDNRLKVLETK
tara:strand:- start:519 stop:1742 length:1224 start_codon:yes stop_codon:yes gene_type:complete